MIGRVTYRYPSRPLDPPVVLVLGDDLVWTSAERPDIADDLNDYFGIVLAESGPADGNVAVAEVVRVSRALGGTYELEAKKPAPDDRVY
ncbi:MAG TPA: hypothetical protein VN719_09685 [Gemmatimonadales bacterium]|nr:hypothetical protein [Gemmatimonadales bacterium]